MKLKWMAGVLVLLVGCASTAENKIEEKNRKKLISTHVQLAGEYMQRGQLEYAKENIDRGLAVDDGDSQLNNMAGLLYWKLKNYDKAEDYFRRAVDINEKNSEARNNLGVFLCEQKRIDDAIEHFEAALADALYKTPASAALNAGVCLMQKPDRKRAEVFFRQALDIQPKMATALFNMARISYETGRFLSARGFIERYFSAHTDTPEALALGFNIEKALGGRDLAASYRLRLKGKFPDSREAQAAR